MLLRLIFKWTGVALQVYRRCCARRARQDCVDVTCLRRYETCFSLDCPSIELKKLDVQDDDAIYIVEYNTDDTQVCRVYMGSLPDTAEGMPERSGRIPFLDAVVVTNDGKEVPVQFNHSKYRVRGNEFTKKMLIRLTRVHEDDVSHVKIMTLSDSCNMLVYHLSDEEVMTVK